MTRIVLLDTFDWRVHRHGKVFEAEFSDDGSLTYVWRDRRSRGTERRVVAETLSLPRFAWDFPQELRSKINATVDIRAVLHRGEVKRVRCTFGEPGDRLPGKLHLDRYSLIDPAGESQVVASRLVLTSQPPDSKVSRCQLEQWAEKMSLARAPKDIWDETLTAAGRAPRLGDHAAELPMMPDLRADQAVRRILLPLCETMQANVPGLIANLDSEFLHDFRVAVRRCRSAISQLKQVFPERNLGRYARELKHLGAMTGPARDLDVYLLKFAELQALLPDFMRSDLAPLRALLEERAAKEHARLVTFLGGRRYRTFMQECMDFLRKPVPTRPSASNALVPIGVLLQRRIWKLYRRIVRTDHWVSENAPAEAIHELRKTCKKIRYLLEFAQPLFGADKLRSPIKDLKALQNHLGAFQDAEVQIGHLRQWSVDRKFLRSAPGETLLAIGALIGRLDEIQQERRRRIPQALSEFGSKENRARFRQLFGA